MDQKTLQQKAFQLQMHEEEAKQARQEILRLNAQLQELERVSDCINHMGKEKEGQDALIPLGCGIFVSGKIGSANESVVLVGAGVAVTKTSAEAEKFLGEKSAMIKKAISEIESEIKRIGASAQAISREMQDSSGPVHN